MSKIKWFIEKSNKIESFYANNSTSLVVTPAWITAWIFSLGPSDKYEIAQHVSANTSESRL
jgi:hypothetical protein